jgi:hypothetical protein
MKPLTFLGSIAIVLGVYYFGRRERKGCVFQFIGSALSIVHFSFISFDISVVVLNCLLATIAAVSWWKWAPIVTATVEGIVPTKVLEAIEAAVFDSEMKKKRWGLWCKLVEAREILTGKKLGEPMLREGELLRGQRHGD